MKKCVDVKPPNNFKTLSRSGSVSIGSLFITHKTSHISVGALLYSSKTIVNREGLVRKGTV